MLLNMNGKRMKITIEGKVTSHCPINKELDFYDYSVWYIPRDKMLEGIAFRESLEHLKEEEMTCEGLCSYIDDLILEVNPYRYHVVVEDNSMGLNIRAEIDSDFVIGVINEIKRGVILLWMICGLVLHFILMVIGIEWNPTSHYPQEYMDILIGDVTSFYLVIKL